MSHTKKHWIEPEVITLIREGKREELILTVCKSASTGAAVEADNSGCYDKGGTCPDCITISNS